MDLFRIYEASRQCLNPSDFVGSSPLLKYIYIIIIVPILYFNEEQLFKK